VKEHPVKKTDGNPTAWTEASVCLDCFEDPALSEFVKANASSPTCDFCGASADEDIAVAVTEIAAHIEGCLRSEYDDAANGVSWDGREGGWQGATTWDTAELLAEVGLELPNDRSYKLRRALLNALPSLDWSEREPYGYNHDEFFQYSWDRFCETIKHRSRFFFSRESRRR